MVKIKGCATELTSLEGKKLTFTDALSKTGIAVLGASAIFYFVIVPLLLNFVIGIGYEAFIDLLSMHGFEVPMLTLDQLYLSFGIFAIFFLGITMMILDWRLDHDIKTSALVTFGGFSCAFVILYFLIPTVADIFNLVIQPIPIFTDLGWLLDFFAKDLTNAISLLITLIIVFWMFSALWLWELSKRYEIKSPIILAEDKRKMKDKRRRRIKR